MQKKESSGHSEDRLYRSEKNRVIGGVAGGLGEYFGIDYTIIRVIFVLLTIFGGYGILIYLILWFIMPSEHSDSRSFHIDNKDEIKEKIRQFAHNIRAQSDSHTRVWVGFVLILLGLLFFANNLNLFYFADLGRLWPLILVLLGIALLGRK